MSIEEMEEIETKAILMAYELRDSCDGSSVGAECKETINLFGEDVLITVVAFWEKSFWGEYTAKSKSIDESGSF